MAVQRIVSMLASATEILTVLGLEDRLVAISHECDYPERVLDRPRISRPRFDPEGLDGGAIDRAVRQAVLEHGSVYEIDADRLDALHPDLILTQAVCAVCAVPTPGVEKVVAARAIDARVLSLDAHTLDGILRTIEQVGAATGAEARAGEVVARLRERLRDFEHAVAGRPRPRVLGIEWFDPPFLPGHWVPEQIERAGGECVAGETAQPSREAGWQDLAGMDPDVLILMPCGYGLAETIAEADRAAQHLLAIAPRAIREKRAYAVDGSSFFNRSGPRAVDGVEILASLLHPEAVRRDTQGEAVVWGA